MHPPAALCRRGASWLTAEGQLYFDTYGAATIGCLLSIFLLYVLGVARTHGAAEATLLATMLAAAMPVYFAVVYATANRGEYALLMVALWGLFIVVALRRSARPLRAGVPSPSCLRSVRCRFRGINCPHRGSSTVTTTRHDDVTPGVYTASRLSRLEIGLLPQNGRVDLYFVGFAGDAAIAPLPARGAHARSCSTRTMAGGRSCLSNDSYHLDEAPPANRHNLARVLEDVAARMDVDEDALFLFLTSHGSADGELTVSLYPFELVNLTAEDVRDALDDAGIGWRMIVISACHSGSFIDTLRDTIAR